MPFFHFKLSPAKSSSGAKARIFAFLVSLLAVAFFGISDVKAFDTCNQNDPVLPCTYSGYNYDTGMRSSSNNDVVFFVDGSVTITDMGVAPDDYYVIENTGGLVNGVVYMNGIPYNFDNISISKGANFFCEGVCSYVNNPPSETDITCSFSFASLPDWTDPWGMFKGLFSELFGWLGCAINSIGDWIHDSVISVSMIVGDFFGEAIDTFTAFFTASWWGDIAMFVFAPNVVLMDATINSQSDVLHEKLPNFFDFYSNFGSDAPENSGDVKIFEGDLSLNGQSAHMIYDPFHSLPIPEFIPTLLTALMYLSLGFWLLRNLSNLFPE